ncbi:MAG: hypothetical protein JSV19_05480 [Phycisphaerales bacterium]|nr:MAG: hypothetical protein JSV19_05480 [Phycisphaerales bacterium]
MILVVALLGILFVAGAAFLQTVTFRARVIQADTDARQDLAVVDQVGQSVSDVLKRGFLGEDSVAYSNAGIVVDGSTGLPFGSPAYGEIPGVHPILSPIEPHMPGTGSTPQELVYATYTDLALALRDTIPVMATSANVNVLFCNGDVGGGMLIPVDADGDGVYDSQLMPDFFNVGASSPRVPRAQWEATVSRLRASDATDENLVVGVRVIAHGGMVDVNHAHRYMIGNVLADDPSDAAWGAAGLDNSFEYTVDPNTQGAYAPAIEERALRRRFVLPSRSLTGSSLQQTLQNNSWFPDGWLLLGALGAEPGVSGTVDAYHWWYFNPSDANNGSPYHALMRADWSNPDHSGYNGGSYSPDLAKQYDRRHLITTVSCDDLLIRGVRFPDFGSTDSRSGKDIVEWMTSETAIRQQFYLDNYPYPYGLHKLAGAGKRRDASDTDASDDDEENMMVGAQLDPRVGRIQLSLPWLDQFLVDNGVDLNLVSSGDGNVAIINQFIGMIQDMFWVMLWNHPDLDHDGDIDDDDAVFRARLAASLTANLIDFADDNDVPTAVPPVRWNDANQQMEPVDPLEFAYGLERQPYLTEAYMHLENDGSGNLLASQSVYAIELYNPYATAISLNGYVVQTVSGDYPLSGLLPGRDDAVAPADRFRVYVNGTTNLTSMNPIMVSADVDSTTMADFRMDTAASANVVTLWRDIDGSASVTPGDVLADALNPRGDDDWTTPSGGSAVVDASMQRDKRTAGGLDPVIAPPDDPPGWRFSVAWQPVTTGPHGLKQHPDSVIGGGAEDNIRPVQIEFANSGSLAGAYPTTGSLLLFMRHAYSTRAPSQAPTDKLFDDPTTTGFEYRQIDNGRMPVFDIGDLDATPPGSAPYHHQANVNRLEGLPWGQLVFDYFTALPLDNAAVWDDTSFDNRAIPRVDQAGARVYGRININVAPYKVMAGLPMRSLVFIPAPFQDNIRKGAYPLYAFGGGTGEPPVPTLGYEVAHAIEAYREARFARCSEPPPDGCSGTYEDRPRLDGAPPTDPAMEGLRSGRGLLTVGELANVRHLNAASRTLGSVTYSDFRVDGGVTRRTISEGGEDYVQAIARLVLLGDWVTTRSHVFTIYGTIRGPSATTGTAGIDDPSLEEAIRKSIRFEETVNRLPCFFDPGAAPQRIGQRVVGRYREARAD